VKKNMSLCERLINYLEKFGVYIMNIMKMGGYKKVNYSFRICYRVKKNSERERCLLETSEEYGVEPGCKLLDRMFEDDARRHKFRASMRCAAAERIREI